MNIEQLRADFEAHFSSPPFEWEFHRYGEDSAWPGNYQLYEHQCAWEAYQASRAALQSQTIPYAGVTVWVGNKRCSHGVTKDELELSTFDILQAAFDHARRVEGDRE